MEKCIFYCKITSLCPSWKCCLKARVFTQSPRCWSAVTGPNWMTASYTRSDSLCSPISPVQSWITPEKLFSCDVVILKTFLMFRAELFNKHLSSSHVATGGNSTFIVGNVSLNLSSRFLAHCKRMWSRVCKTLKCRSQGPRYNELSDYST